MADTIEFELVSPEHRLAHGAAKSVVIPGQLGEFTAMPDHAPFLSTLRPGYVTVEGGEAAGRYFVTGGFAEVSPESVAVLAEEAVAADDVTADWLAEKVKAAEAAHDEAAGAEAVDEDRKQITLQRLNDFKALAG